MELMETQFAARLGLGGAGDLIGDLEAAVAAYGYQEGLWELLITALYRAGRQADALATYQRVRTLLADELGLAPGPRLQELERRILVHDSALGIGDRALRALEAHARAGNLPSLSAELVGRETEIAAVSDLLASHRLVEIVGPGGIGKTAVAIAAGRKLAEPGSVAPGGVWLARLETATTADDVLDTVIAALHVTGGEAALLERLKTAAAVVILDNCEHVLDAAAALAVRLLDAAPALRILCTSQVPLDVDGEAVFELAPLGPAGRRGAVHPPSRCPRPGREHRRSRRCDARAVPLARRPAAGDRARRGAHEDAVDRGDQPPPRRPLQRAERPDQPQAGAPPRTEGDDRVELRAALPRRPAGPVGARHVRRRRAPRRGRARARGARRARVGGDRRRRPAREPLARHRRRRGPDPFATGCSTASARSRSRRWPRPG